MKYLSIFLMLITIFTFSCTPEKVVFEKETWWNGHWQKVSDSTIYFSSGQKKVGGNEIVTPQFFISTKDSIQENFYLEELVEFNYKQKYKLIKTSEDTYIKLQEIDEDHIEVSGPVPSIDEMDSLIHEYRRLPSNVDPPFPDSILYDL